MLRQGKLAKEISGHVEAFVNERMTTWRERELPAAVEPRFSVMRDQIAAVAGEVEAQFDEIHANLPSLGARPKAKRAVGWGQRIVMGAGHLVIGGGAVGAVAAGAGGWQASVGAFGAGIAAAIGLGLAGMSLPVIMAGIALAQAVGGVGAAQIRLEKRAVEKVRTATEKQLAGFRTEWSVAIREVVEQQFAGLKARIVEDATLIINEKIREIEAMQELSRKGVAERAAESERLTGLLADIKKADELLEGSMAAAQQA